MCFFGGGPDIPDPPDMSGLYEAINRQTALMEKFGERAFEFQEQAYADQKALLDDIVAVQLPLMEEQADWAREFQARYEEFYVPIEEALSEMAATYDTPERREREAARAMQDVRQSYEAQRERATDELISYGIDPSQLQRQALDTSVRTAEAATEAGAANQARQRVEDRAQALQFNVANIGRGYPGEVQDFSAGAVGTGGQVAGQSTATNAAFLPYAGNPQPWYQGAMQGQLGLGNLQNQVYGNQIRGAAVQGQYGSDLWSGVGQLAGTGLGIWAGAGFPGFQEGGVVPEPTGEMPAEQGQAIPTASMPDRTAAALTPGEYVVPADVVRWKGEEFFNKLETKSREGRDMAIGEQRAEQAVTALPVGPRPPMQQAGASPNIRRLQSMRGTAAA